MAYHRTRRALAGDMSHGPSWYRAMGGVSTRFPGARVAGRAPALGSLGDDAPAANTLSAPTLTDPTFQWQGQVLAQLKAGVDTMKKAELQKWLQIIATVSIPLSAAIWRLIFRRGAPDPTV